MAGTRKLKPSTPAAKVRRCNADSDAEYEANIAKLDELVKAEEAAEPSMADPAFELIELTWKQRHDIGNSPGGHGKLAKYFKRYPFMSAWRMVRNARVYGLTSTNAMQMHYEGVVVIRELTSGAVNLFDLNDAVLRDRWTKLICAFAFAGRRFKIPDGWLAPELFPRPAEISSPANYLRRAQRVIAAFTEQQLNQHIIALAKVHISSCICSHAFVYVRAWLFLTSGSVFFYVRVQICAGVHRLVAGQPVDSNVSIKSVLSVVNANLHNSGASERFYEQVEPGSQLARPKLVGFHAPADPHDCQYAVYMNRSVMFDDSFHLTTSVARALVHLECV